MTERQAFLDYFRAAASKEGLDLQNLNFHICKDVVSPGSRGIYNVRNNWYLYEYDDRCRKCINGPHSFDTIAKIVAIELHFKVVPQLTEQEETAYIYSGRWLA